MAEKEFPPRRADFFVYVVHFTKESNGQTALENLKSILNEKVIHAHSMTWFQATEAVCFTECTWPSLLSHCKYYSN